MKRSLVMGLLLLALLPLWSKIEQRLEKPDTLYLGSRFILHIKGDKDLRSVTVPDTLTRFAVLKSEPEILKDKPAGLKLTLTALDTGEQTFPSLIVHPAKPEADTLITQPFTLKILEVRSAKDTTLVDIAGTQKLPGELPWWAYYVIGGLLAVGIIILIIVLLRKYAKKKDKPVTAPVVKSDTRLPWQIALADLQALKTEHLPEQGEHIAFHYRLSEIMKIYLEAELHFSANEMTTREIKYWFREKSNFDPPQIKEITVFLENCDRVKFAKYTPTIESGYELLDWMADWLNQKGRTQVTTPQDKQDA